VGHHHHCGEDYPHVEIGTSMPVITLLPIFDRQAMVDLAFYGPAVAPFGLLLLVTMAIAPLLGWQPAKYGALRKALKWPLILTAITLFVCLLLNIVYPVALLFIAAAVFGGATNAVVIWRIWRAGPLKLGGYLCHIGVALLFVGIVGTSVYKQTAPLQLVQDTPQLVFGRQFTLRGLVLPPEEPLGRSAVQIEVTDPRGGRTWVAEAPYYIFQKTYQLVIHPAILSGLWTDLYVAPSEFLPPAQPAPGRVRLVKEQPVEALGYSLTFKRFDLPEGTAMMDGQAAATVGAVLAVTVPGGATTTVTPTMRLEAGKAPEGVAAALPGAATLTMQRIEPESQAVTLQFGGVDLSRVRQDDLKARAFVEVSREPGIKFVWSGIILALLGGLLALLRRWHEARPAAAPRPRAIRSPLPEDTLPAPQAGIAHVVIESEAS